MSDALRRGISRQDDPVVCQCGAEMRRIRWEPQPIACQVRTDYRCDACRVSQVVIFDVFE
jgi:hypothetical protein